MKQTIKKLLITAPILSLASLLTATTIERDGFVEIEAESFSAQSKDSIRKWYIVNEQSKKLDLRDDDENHAATASGKSYIELLPDTRTNHSEKLITGVNFSNEAGVMSILSYPIEFTTPGKYVVWICGYSTGTEDNGLHVGIDGTWPESGQRLQWCDGKQNWTWTSAQRVEHNHCGYPKTISLTIDKPGLHDLQLSMREDGVEIDRIILVNDKHFEPEGFEMPNKDAPFEEKISSNGNIRLDFAEYDLKGSHPFYRDYDRSAYAINAGNEAYRTGFAKAQTSFNGESGNYELSLTTLTEVDGESTYKISINDKVVGKYQNKKTEIDYNPNHLVVKNIAIKKGDIIAVESCAHTNGKIPEGDSTAWSRGRWQKLTLTPSGSQNHSH